MSRFYEYQSIEDNIELHDQASGVAKELLKLVLVFGTRNTAIMLTRALTCVIALMVSEKTGNPPPENVADDREEFQETVMAIFEEQAVWSEDSKTINATRGPGAINN